MEPSQIDIIRIATRDSESSDHRLALVVFVLRYRLALNSPGEMHGNIYWLNHQCNLTSELGGDWYLHKLD